MLCCQGQADTVRQRTLARRFLRWRRLSGLAAVTIVAPLLSGCSLLGGLSGSRQVAPASMTVTSPEFRTALPLPPQYTCAGPGLSPPLYWSGAFSQQPRSFAVVVDDGQAPITPFVYWIVFDISPTTTAIAQNRLPTTRRALRWARSIRIDLRSMRWMRTSNCRTVPACMRPGPR